MTWEMVRLGDVAQVLPGYAFASKEWREDGIPVVKIKNIQGDGTVDMQDADCVSENFLMGKTSRFAVRQGDYLIAMTGATAGKVGMYREEAVALLNQRVAKLIPKTIDSRFFWSVISSQEYQDTFFRMADGAAQPNMSGGQIEGVEIPLPPLPTQRKIAAILSAYDDLIENNTRRVRVLEQMARALYREWFVEYRYPGHEQAQWVEDEAGRRPQGWEWTTLSQRARILMGQAPKSEFYNKTGDGLPFHQGVGTFGEHFPRHETYCTDLGRVAKQGDILFSVRAPVGRTNIADRELVVGRGICAIRHVEEAQTFTLLQLNDRIQEDSVGNGAIFKAVTKADMHAIEWLEPPPELLKQFEYHAETLWAQIFNLSQRNANLRQTRDLLLPRLVSGELDVSGLRVAGVEEEFDAVEREAGQ